MHRALALLLLFITTAAVADEARVEALLKQMTLEEKLGQLTHRCIHSGTGSRTRASSYRT